MNRITVFVIGVVTALAVAGIASAGASAAAPEYGRCVKVAKGAGVSRVALYKAFSDKGDPKLSTVFSVLGTLNLKLSAQTGKLRVVKRSSKRSVKARADAHGKASRGRKAERRVA